jgi:4-amino-4-deoxy-L-arabinose transferase-like glycosyltransferase
MQLHRILLLRIAGLFLSCILAVEGIHLLRTSSIVPGLIVTVIGAALFVLTVIVSEKYPLGETDLNQYKPYIAPFLLLAGSFVFLFVSILEISNPTRPQATDRVIAGSWIASLICLAVGISLLTHWRPPTWKQFIAWIKTNQMEILLVAALVLLAFVIRSYDLTKHPYPWSGDEASVGMEGLRILKGEVTNFFEAGWSGQPNWSFVPTAVSEIIFGKTILAVRIVSVIEGTLAVFFLYLLARELFGKTIAALASAFLVALPVHLQFSRIGVNNIIDSMNICLVVWLVVRAIRKGRIIDYTWAGIVSGLAFYTYVGSRLVTIIAIGVIGYTILRQRGYLRSNIKQLAVFVVGLLFTLAPLGYYFFSHPDIFMTRLGQESIFLNHWLVNTARDSGQPVSAILWKQFTDTVLVYISQPAIGNFLNFPIPYLTILGSIFFIFGMGYAFTKVVQTRMVILLAWFWSDVIIGGVLTLSPPANTRLVMSNPAVAIFLALGIFYMTDLLLRWKFVNVRWQTAIAAALILILIGQNYAFYFGVYKYKDYFSDANGELAQAVGLELQKLGPNYDYYLFGAPRIFAGFPTTAFLAPDNSLIDLNAENDSEVTLRPGKGQIFVAIPENKDELKVLAAKFPGGTWETIMRNNTPEILYYAYIIDQ